MDHPEGARETGDVRLGFDRRVRLEFRGTQLSSDGGLLVMRDRRRRSGRKMLVQRSDSGNLHVSRHATWGMSDHNLGKAPVRCFRICGSSSKARNLPAVRNGP